MDTRPSTDFSLILELLSGYMFLIDLGLGISKPADESGNVVSCNRSFTSAFCLSHVVTGNQWKTLYAVTSFPLIFFGNSFYILPINLEDFLPIKTTHSCIKDSI